MGKNENWYQEIKKFYILCYGCKGCSNIRVKAYYLNK